MPQTIKISPNITLFQSDQELPVTASWFDPEFWQSNNSLAGTGLGRGAVWFINSTFGHFVIRRYRRGGLISKINKQYFLFTGTEQTRPWLELKLLEQMRTLGLPVPRPIGGLMTLNKGFYRAELLTETIPDASDLFDIVKSDDNKEIDWKEIGRVIKDFHNYGVYHSDLNCHNIMIDNDNKVWVIDFDKCELKTPHRVWQQSNIDRLKRSINKETSKHSTFHVSDKQWQAFLEGYHG